VLPARGRRARAPDIAASNVSREHEGHGGVNAQVVVGQSARRICGRVPHGSLDDSRGGLGHALAIANSFAAAGWPGDAAGRDRRRRPVHFTRGDALAARAGTDASASIATAQETVCTRIA
jgi:hypothetical protein